MKNKTFRLSSALLVLLFWNLAAWAQEPVQPEIEAVKTGVSAEFEVEWGTCADCYPSTPTPLPEPVSSDFEGEPRWVYFWEFGDGGYSFDPAPTHTYRRNGNFDVGMRAVAIYSDIDKPNRIMNTMNINAVPIGQEGRVSNFFAVDEGRRLKFDSNWNSTRAGDTITCAISYRGGNTPGSIQLHIPAGRVSLLGVRNPMNAKLSAPITTNSYDLDIIEWEFDTLAQGEEPTFFFDFAVQVSEGNQFSILAEMILPEDAPPVNTVTAGEFFNFIPLENTEVTPSVPNNGYVPSIADQSRTQRQHFTVNAARDPNFIEVEPDTIPPGTKVHQLTYTIHFENIGTASAQVVELNSFLDGSKLDAPTLQTQTLHVPNTPNFTAPIIPNNSLSPNWVLRRNGLSNLLPPTAQGYVGYTIATKSGQRLVKGDRIRAQALIKMGDTVMEDTLLTNIAYVEVQRQKGLALPFYFGVKAGINNRYADFRGFVEQGGFHAGVTLRKALSTLPIDYRYQPHFSITSLPEFWYQAELMVSNLKFSADSSNRHNYWMLELIPLQVRYVPNLSMITYLPPRSLAFSAGYKAALLLNAEVNDGQVNLSNNRIEHTLFADVAVLNILGKPGISLGFRPNWRLNQVVSGGIGSYYQLYLHLNL